MNALAEASFKYIEGIIFAIEAFGEWCERHARSKGDVVLMALMPFFLVGLIFYVLPGWIGKAFVVLTVLPVLLFVVCVLYRLACSLLER